MSQEAASQCTAGHGGNHEASKDHAMRQVLAIWAEGGRPKKHKGVHAALKQGLHGPQQADPWICTGTTYCQHKAAEARAVKVAESEQVMICNRAYIKNSASCICLIIPCVLCMQAR